MDYHRDRFEDFSLLVYKDEKLIALLPANRVNHEAFSHQGLTYGGLVFKANLKLKVVLECFKAVLEFFDREGIAKFHLKEFPSIYSGFPNDELQYLMFILNAKLTRRDVLSVVNMAHKIKFSKNRLEGCKRAKKYGLRVKEVVEFDSFWTEILIPNLAERHQVLPVHSLDEITLLKKRFPRNIRQFNVYHENTLVAGTTIFETNTVAHTQYISGNADKNKFGSLDILHHYLIEEVFRDKDYFDFGISNENQGRNINHGLQYWKEGFGARTITQDFYSVDIANHKNLNSVFI